MSRIFSFSTRENPAEEQLIEIGDDAADPVCEALASDTARDVTAAIYQEPRTASELADYVDTSLQNVQYHIGKLETAGIIMDVGTAHAESGNQMTLYGPTHDPLVLVAQSSETKPMSSEQLKDVLGVVGIIGVLSLLAQWIVTRIRATTVEVTFTGPGPEMNQPDPLWGLPAGLVVFAVGLILVAGWTWYRT